MMNARALALLLTLTACGASAGPTPAGDAGSDTGADAADGRACGDRETFTGGQCVPNTDSMCGPTRRACTAPQRCVVSSGGGGDPTVECMTL